MSAQQLSALRQLHDVCLRMDDLDEAKRPSEAEYQAAMAAARRAIADADFADDLRIQNDPRIQLGLRTAAAARAQVYMDEQRKRAAITGYYTDRANSGQAALAR